MICKAYAQTPSGEMHCRRVDGAGIPIVLLHRTPVDSACFEGMLREMDGRRAAIALDTPGFGQSFGPVGRPAARDYAAWFLAALDDLGVAQFHLCAHHTGTHFAIELARLAPDRTRSLLLSGVLYAGADERRAMRRQIGDALPIDEDGAYLSRLWSITRSFFQPFQAALAHAEFLGAAGSPEGRDQAFDAILRQDFAGLLGATRCPMAIVQPVDDPLASMLDRVRNAHPAIPITLLGPAGIAAPECQPVAYAASAMAFAAAYDTPKPFTTERGSTVKDRRMQLVRSGSRFRLDSETFERPEPGPGQVLVRVHAAAINRRDNMILKNEGYPIGDADRFTPLSDAAGEVVALGADVQGVSAGDRVCSCFFQNWEGGRVSLPALFSALGAGGPGVLADHVVLSAKGVAAIPADWSFAAAATLPCAGVTAWTSVMNHGPVLPGDWVLVMGTGGVSIFALQIAVAAGARVAVISSSDDKLERTRALGASATVNYRDRPDWDVAVREVTGGVDHVVELGGAGTLGKSLACLNPGGHAALVGGLDGFGGEISATGMIIGAQRVSAVSVGSREDLVALIGFAKEHGINPVIDDILPFEAAESAYARADEGVFGKMVIQLA